MVQLVNTSKNFSVTRDTSLKVDRNNIMYFMDYHPYRKNTNPNFDSMDGKILDLKKETFGKESSNYIYETIKPEIKNYFMKNNLSYKDFSVAIVPSSTSGKRSMGMEHLVEYLCRDFGMENKVDMLYRHQSIKKMTEGGDRSIFSHYKSVIVNNTTSNKRIILLDDVTTTGCSLIACAKILEEQGYEVTCIAISKTIDEYKLGYRNNAYNRYGRRNYNRKYNNRRYNKY